MDYSKEWLVAEFESETSKKQVSGLARLAVKHERLLQSFFDLTEDNNHKYNWRAAWALDHLNQIEPELIQPRLARIINTVIASKSDAVRRSLLKVIASHELPNSNEGLLMDYCFSLLNNNDVSIAVRAWCMDILLAFSIRYPSIKNELRNSLLQVIEYGSAGEKNRALKTLRIVDKES